MNEPHLAIALALHAAAAGALAYSCIRNWNAAGAPSSDESVANAILPAGVEPPVRRS